MRLFVIEMRLRSHQQRSEILDGIDRAWNLRRWRAGGSMTRHARGFTRRRCRGSRIFPRRRVAAAVRTPAWAHSCSEAPSASRAFATKPIAAWQRVFERHRDARHANDGRKFILSLPPRNEVPPANLVKRPQDTISRTRRSALAIIANFHRVFARRRKRRRHLRTSAVDFAGHAGGSVRRFSSSEVRLLATLVSDGRRISKCCAIYMEKLSAISRCSRLRLPSPKTAQISKAPSRSSRCDWASVTSFGPASFAERSVCRNSQ